jgi:succinate dehydrogenase/fumarate reductase flavoprotein subunit
LAVKCQGGPTRLRGALGLSIECSIQDLINIMELRSARRIAGLLLQAELERKESRGPHLRVGFRKQNDEKWLGHFQVAVIGGEDTWEFQPEVSDE